MDIIEIANQIVEKGGNLYQVGGSIRDSLLHIPCKDEDYCVTGMTPKTFCDLFPQAKYRGKKFAVWELEGKEFALARKETKTGSGHKDFQIETGVTIRRRFSKKRYNH